MATNPTATSSKVPATAKQPADHQPKGDTAADAKPAGWELLKPFDQVPVWEQTDLIHIVTPLLDVKQGDELSFSDFDVRIVGQLAQKLQEYALDQEAYLTFVSGPGALQRAMELGVAYATQLGE